MEGLEVRALLSAGPGGLQPLAGPLTNPHQGSPLAVQVSGSVNSSQTTGSLPGGGPHYPQPPVAGPAPRGQLVAVAPQGALPVAVPQSTVAVAPLLLAGADRVAPGGVQVAAGPVANPASAAVSDVAVPAFATALLTGPSAAGRVGPAPSGTASHTGAELAGSPLRAADQGAAVRKQVVVLNPFADMTALQTAEEAAPAVGTLGAAAVVPADGNAVADSRPLPGRQGDAATDEVPQLVDVLALPAEVAALQPDAGVQDAAAPEREAGLALADGRETLPGRPEEERALGADWACVLMLVSAAYWDNVSALGRARRLGVRLQA